MRLLKWIFRFILSLIIVAIIAISAFTIYFNYFVPKDRINNPNTVIGLPTYDDPAKNKNKQRPTYGLEYQPAILKDIDLKNNYVYIRYVDYYIGSSDLNEKGDIVKYKVTPKTYIFKAGIYGDERISLKDIPKNSFIGVNSFTIYDKKQDELKYLIWKRNDEPNPGYN